MRIGTLLRKLAMSAIPGMFFPVPNWLERELDTRRKRGWANTSRSKAKRRRRKAQRQARKAGRNAARMKRCHRQAKNCRVWPRGYPRLSLRAWVIWLGRPARHRW